MDRHNHELAVEAFLAACEERDKKHYDDVCRKYPVQTRARQKVVRQREISGCGLIGLQPSNISIAVAVKHGIESVHMEEGG